MTGSDPMPTPMISVVMPVYEPHPEYFRIAVESILAQRMADWELIIVEDPSDRSAAEMLQTISDPRIRHIVNKQRTSLVDQRNLALETAQGRFIAMMDADDMAHPFRLVRQVMFLNNHPEIGVVGTQVSVIDSEHRIAGYRRYPVLHDDILHAISRTVPLGQPTVMLRREVIESFGGYRFREYPAAEDYALWSRLIQAGVRFANLPDVLFFYRIHNGQIKISKLRETISAVLRVKELYWANRLDLPARLRMWAERMLLYLPKSMVAWMLLTAYWHYRWGKTGASVAELVQHWFCGADS